MPTPDQDPVLAQKIAALFRTSLDVAGCQEGVGIMYETFDQLVRIKAEYLELQQRMLDHTASCPQCLDYGIVLRQLMGEMFNGLT